MRVQNRKRVFILLSCLLSQCDAEITCGEGFTGTVEIAMVDTAMDETKDTQCGVNELCARFEIPKMNWVEPQLDSVAVVDCMAKDECEANKQLVTEQDLKDAVNKFIPNVDGASLSDPEGDIKFACCNYADKCNIDNEVSKMIEAQEEHENSKASSGIKSASKIFNIFTAFILTVLFF